MKNYVQIGANIGNDNFQRKIEKLIEPSRIILVEPNNNLLEELKNNYKTCSEKHEIIICNKAISLKNEKTALYIYNSGHNHSSLINRRSWQAGPREVLIEAITFEHLCETYNIKEIELLQIDTEGLDYEIINTIDFSKIDVNTLIFEKWDITNDDLNNKYNTGTQFFEQVIQQKLKNHFTFKDSYEYETVNNYVLTKK